MIWERLHRGVANYEWLARFPTRRVKHLNCFTSDHWPILLSLDVNGEHQKWRKKPFRFEAMWVSDSGCREVITRAWDCTANGTPMFATTTKLKRCKNSLKAWSQDHFGNEKKSIKQTKNKLWKTEDASARFGDFEEVDRLKRELNVLQDKE
ncbi:uncharacterized protein LOC142643979 [Castanea sativa]|uniref:uncharacterized protein LOC142643979 n=1 Tax=Castanea sativa TaxID=21020 RepID=UPI003F652B2B